MNEVSVERASGRQGTLWSAKLRDFLLPLLKRWLREPLLHFLLIGIAVFAVYAYMHRGRGGVESSRQIVLTLDELQQMDTYFVFAMASPADSSRVSGHGGRQGPRGSPLPRRRWPWASIKTTPS